MYITYWNFRTIRPRRRNAVPLNSAPRLRDRGAASVFGELGRQCVAQLVRVARAARQGYRIARDRRKRKDPRFKPPDSGESPRTPSRRATAMEPGDGVGLSFSGNVSPLQRRHLEASQSRIRPLDFNPHYTPPS